MIFINKLYQIQKIAIEESVIKTTICLDANHEIYSGHFPDNPITPGVVQLEIAKEILSVHFKCPISLISMRNAKYLAVLNPTTHPIVNVHLNIELIDENNFNVSGDFTSNTVVFMKFQSSYRK